MGPIDYIKDRYLTWKTGKDRETREWIRWYESTVVCRANTIPNMFMNFKHVIEVSNEKFLDYNEPFSWVPCEDAQQYFWPQCELSKTAVWRFERVYWDQWEQCWHINDLMGSEDKVFVATNSDEDATMMALKYV